MTDQPDLFTPAMFDSNLARRTDKWIKANPVLWGFFLRFALEAGRAGIRFGIGMITERVRYECRVKWKGEFKINNSYRAYIARRLVQEYPHLRDLIEMRGTAWGTDPKADSTESRKKPVRTHGAVRKTS